MKWLSFKIPKGHRSSWLKPILLFAVILCFLMVFNPTIADELTDPGSPNWGHPWDDPAGAEDNNPNPPEEDDAMLLQIGIDGGIIILFQSGKQEENLQAGRPFASAKKSRGHLLILIK
jgi:hypothetical protein